MTPDIFLSYSREDQPTAQRFAEAFTAQRWSVWWDVTLRSGEAYDQVTEEALRTAKAVVVLWSKTSVVSRWVRAEATLADRNRTLVPAMIEACERPIMFELTQAADLSRWTGLASDPAWRGFLADVRRYVDGDGAAKLVAPVPPSAVTTAAHREPPSLAVLPFISRSGRGEDDTFAASMVEDLTAALSMNPRIQVVAASATATFRSARMDLRQIGEDLAVHYLLEGNIRRVAEHLRVTVQLVDARTGAILWAKKFDRSPAEDLGLEDDLVMEVAAHLGVQVERVEMEHALKSPGQLSAWEAWMRFNAYSSRSTRADWKAGLAEARRATEIEPDYGMGYALLATAQAWHWIYRGGSDAKLAQEIADNVRRARALEPNNPLVLAVIAMALADLGKLHEALPLAQRAVAMNPSFEIGRLALGAVLVRGGRGDEALDELDEADRLAPNSWLLYYSSVWRSAAHLQSGRFGLALDAADRAERTLPGQEALIQRAVCLVQLGRPQEARDALRRLLEDDPGISLAEVDHIVGAYCRHSDALSGYLAALRTVWDDAANAPSSP